jgi:hypothetical protein
VLPLGISLTGKEEESWFVFDDSDGLEVVFALTLLDVIFDLDSLPERRGGSEDIGLLATIPLVLMSFIW